MIINYLSATLSNFLNLSVCSVFSASSVLIFIAH